MNSKFSFYKMTELASSTMLYVPPMTTMFVLGLLRDAADDTSCTNHVPSDGLEAFGQD